jgi:hypothetical protein
MIYVCRSIYVHHVYLLMYIVYLFSCVHMDTQDARRGYVDVCVYIYLCTLCISIHVNCVFIFMCAYCVYVFMCAYGHSGRAQGICGCVCIAICGYDVYVYTCVHTDTHAQTHTYTQTPTLIQTHRTGAEDSISGPK